MHWLATSARPAFNPRPRGALDLAVRRPASENYVIVNRRVKIIDARRVCSTIDGHDTGQGGHHLCCDFATKFECSVADKVDVRIPT